MATNKTNSQKTTPTALLRASLIILFACIPTFEMIAMVGCISTSPAIPNIFLGTLRQQDDNDFELRVGYYGVCARQNKQLACFPTAHTAGASSRLSSSIEESFDNTSSMDSLIALAFPLQSVFQQTLPVALAIYMVGIICGWIFLETSKKHKVKKDPKALKTANISCNIAKGCFWGSTALTLAAALSVTQTEAALQFATSKIADSPVKVSRGVTLEVLQWLSFAFTFLFASAATLLTRGGRADKSSPANPGASSLPSLDPLSSLPPLPPLP